MRQVGRNIANCVMMGVFLIFVLSIPCAAGDVVKVGLNYPKTGPYAPQGKDELRGAEMAAGEINASGGILGKTVEIVIRDSKSDPEVSVANVTELIEKHGVKMIFGGASSGVAVAVGEVCQKLSTIFMTSITNSNATTVEKGHRHTFRACSNAWMNSKALSAYLRQNFRGKKYFYIVADYTWGWSGEDSLRKLTHTTDKSVHKRILTPFGAGEDVFGRAVTLAKLSKPDVLVLVLFGKETPVAIRLATMMGMKQNTQIVVPLIEMNMAEEGGPKVMEGVIGVIEWEWQVAYKYDYPGGKAFVEKYVAKYDRYPSWGSAIAYVDLIEYKNAVERAGTFESAGVIKALEGHKFTLLKDEQLWNDFDHQCIQSVYVVKCKPEAEVKKDKFGLDYFEILTLSLGEQVAFTRSEWNELRQAAGMPPYLEKLPGE